MSGLPTTVRSDELRPGDRIWHPFDGVCFTVDHEPRPETGLHFEGEPGLRVTGTNDHGEIVHVDVAPAYKWHRAPIEDRETAVRELGALPMPLGDAVAVPRTERSYWVDIAAALNAATAAGMPVGVDLDGTLTDRNAWSVVWDPDTEAWTVAGYEDGEESCDHPNGYGPNGCAGCGEFAPTRVEDDVRPQVRKLRALLAGQREQLGPQVNVSKTEAGTTVTFTERGDAS